MAKTNFGLVDWAKKWVGMPYWYGCVCYKCTQDLLTRKTRQYPKHYISNRTARYKADIAGGKWASDCIGLAKGYMWWDAEKGGVRYAVNGCPDMSANGMLECAKVKGDIKDMPEIPGLMLWMDGHAGVYIGNGWAIEERGFAYGCVKTKVADRPWKKWYKLPGLTYMDADDGAKVCHSRPKLLNPMRLPKSGLRATASISATRRAWNPASWPYLTRARSLKRLIRPAGAP